MKASLKKRPLTKVYNAQAGETLGSVLEKPNSSHDPVFVYKDNQFVGLTSPYYAIFKKRFPHQTKVMQATFMPPRITKDTSVFEVAEHMLATKTYKLPLFNSDTVVGVVDARDILEDIHENSVLNDTDINIATPITISSDAKIKDAYAEMKKKKISRLIVVDEKGHLQGVISRRDLQEAFTTPSRKLRYGNKASAPRTWSFDEEKIKRGDYPLHEFYRTDVAKVEEGTTIPNALQEMLRKKVGSVIFINENSEPSGIITTHTFLKALAGLAPTQTHKILLTDKHSVLSDAEKDRITRTLNKLAAKIKRRHKIIQIDAIIDEERNSAGRINLFQVALHVVLDRKQTLNTKVTGDNLRLTLTEACKKIDHQLRSNKKY